MCLWEILNHIDCNKARALRLPIYYLIPFFKSPVVLHFPAGAMVYRVVSVLVCQCPSAAVHTHKSGIEISHTSL